MAGQRGNTPAHTQVPLGAGEARAAGWLVGWDGWREWAPHTPSPVAERMALGVQSVGRGAQACCEERALPFHQAQRLEGRLPAPKSVVLTSVHFPSSVAPRWVSDPALQCCGVLQHGGLVVVGGTCGVHRGTTLTPQ